MENLKKAIEKELGENVVIQDVAKNNGKVLKAVTIPSKVVSPTIYITDLLEKELTENEIALIVAERLSRVPEMDFDLESFMERKNILENVKVKIVNKALNEKMLESVPFDEVANDLVFIYYVSVSDEASITLKYDLLEKIGLDIDTIKAQAIENTKALKNISSMADMLREMGAPDEFVIQAVTDNPMITVTNSLKTNGACIAFIPEITQELFGKYGAFYLLPSSIHEVIIIPKDSTNDNSKADLDTMVREVNASELDPTEILSNHSYYYDGEKWN